AVVEQPDLIPPSVSAIEPAAAAEVWLQDHFRIVFDEPIVATGATVSATLAGAAVPATLSVAGDRTIEVTLGGAVRGTGTLEITLGGVIVDHSDNPVTVPIVTSYMVPAWHRPAVDRG